MRAGSQDRSLRARGPAAIHHGPQAAAARMSASASAAARYRIETRSSKPYSCCQLVASSSVAKHRASRGSSVVAQTVGPLQLGSSGDVMKPIGIFEND